MFKYFIVFVGLVLSLSSCDDNYDDDYDPNTSKFPKYDWVLAADSSSNSTIDRFWNTSRHCFNNTYEGEVADNDYWPEAHGLELMLDNYTRTNSETVKQNIYDFWEGVKEKNYYGDTWENPYYDDMAWHACAHLRAFKITGDTRYEESAEELWHYLTLGWSDYDGGGIKWNSYGTEEGNSKGIPANGPACIAAARRSQMYPNETSVDSEGNEYTDLEWAKMIYNWMRDNRYDPATGRVFENIDDTNNDYSYDVGTFIGSAVELYNITGEKFYLNDAVKAAKYQIAYNIDAATAVYTDWGEQSNDGNGHDCNLFKAIFVRYFTILIQHPDLSEVNRKNFIISMKNNANYLWTDATQKSPDIKFSYSWWYTPEDDVKWGDLRSALSGATMIEKMAELQADGLLD